MVRNTGLTLRCTAAGAAAGVIGTRNAVTMFTPLDTTGTTTLTIPITENWVLTDLYEAGTVMQMTAVMTVDNDGTADAYIFYVAVSIQ